MEITPKKLKAKDIKEVRLKLLEDQGYKCAICGYDCTIEQAVLDHNHGSGFVRAILHRTCNAVEGKIVNSFRRYAIKDPKAYLEGLLKYHEFHSENRTNLIHPTFKTPDEKDASRKAKVKRKREAIKKAKLLQE